MTTRYVLRYAYAYKTQGHVEVENDGRTHYLYKSVSRSRRHGRLNWQITDDLAQARSWATREGAERWLANNLTFPRIADADGIASQFIAVEVTA